MQTFSKVVQYRKIEGTPAAVDVDTGVLYVSQEEMQKLDKSSRAYVLYHELGHLNGHRREKAADRFALQQMEANGYQMTEGVRTLREVLEMQNAAHRNRVVSAFKYARQRGHANELTLNELL